MKSVGQRIVISLIVLLGVAGSLGWLIFERLDEQKVTPGPGSGASKAVPVEVASVRRGPMELRRAFSGAMAARAQFVVAPKVNGRVERLNVNLADTVTRGQIVAALDNAEYVQAVAQARADLEVAKANLAEAGSVLEIAIRELERIDKLQERGITSGSQLDIAKANQLAKKAQLEVTAALVNRAESALEIANIRLGYTKVTAGWSGGNEQRIVAERYVDEGETVSANAPLLRIIELDPITAVIFVTEQDYARLRTGQPAVLTTDAFPAKQFQGYIERIAPVFRQATRQARVELTIANKGLLLKPGMFIQATVVLDQIHDTTNIPAQALTVRDEQNGVFVVDANGQSVAWRKVKVGIREGGRVQVDGEGVSGRVVILGQQLLDDGSTITIAAESSTGFVSGKQIEHQ